MNVKGTKLVKRDHVVTVQNIMIERAGIAIDDADNIYVSSDHKLQKFTSSGELRGSKEFNFNDPCGVTKVYVCDRDNHRIQVFDWI